MPACPKVAPVLPRPRRRRRCAHAHASGGVQTRKGALLASPTGFTVIAISISGPLEVDLDLESIGTRDLNNTGDPASEAV
jgi:hypothetical protein